MLVRSTETVRVGVLLCQPWPGLPKNRRRQKKSAGQSRGSSIYHLVKFVFAARETEDSEISHLYMFELRHIVEIKRTVV